MSVHYVGVGLNPPLEAVAAYHATRTGSSNGAYDVAAAKSVVQMVADGSTWKEAMRLAENDTVRLTALDIASPVRTGVRTFVDDVRVKSASGGHIRMVVSPRQERLIYQLPTK